MSSPKTVAFFSTKSISSLWSVGDSIIWCKCLILRRPGNFTSHNSCLDSLPSKKVLLLWAPITCWNSGSHLVFSRAIQVTRLHEVSSLLICHLFICDLVTSDWIIYLFHFSRLSLANLLMGKSVNICWQFIDTQYPKNTPTKQ